MVKMVASGLDFPKTLFRAEQVRTMDHYAISTLGIAGITLMENAGKVAFNIICDYWPGLSRLLVFCGGGNNGGDGYVVAKLALDAGMSVDVITLSDVAKLGGDAKLAFDNYRMAGGEIKAFKNKLCGDHDLVVDAMLGTGLDRKVTGHYEQAINLINRSHLPVFALDIPSGIQADTGSPLGCAIRANKTVTFIGVKQGLVTGHGREYCGDLHYSDLQVPQQVPRSQDPSAELITFDPTKFNARENNAHKGRYGHVLVIGGDHGFTGAIRLTAEAALRVGAGLVSVATRKDHAAMINLTRPEIMCRGVENGDDLGDLLKRATVIAIGPGLGQTEWGMNMFDIVRNQSSPLIVDADGLNMLANHPCRRNSWILTPHPGEAARLLCLTVSEIESDRFTAAQNIQQKYDGVCVLKGSGTIVFESRNIPSVCDKGNPGMASGGMGDVLTGVIAGLVAQGLTLGDAARQGVFIHSAAADEAAKIGQRGMLACDLMPYLRGLVNL